jgi:hypothetical protein
VGVKREVRKFGVRAFRLIKQQTCTPNRKG